MQPQLCLQLCKAIMSVGLETTHPIIQMVTKTGVTQRHRDSIHIAGRPSFASFDLIGHERSASKESLDGQTGTLKHGFMRISA